MDVTVRVKELTEAILVDPGHFVVDVRYLDKQRPARLLVILDGDHGVNIDICAEVSRGLSKVLDEKDFIPVAYLLEVSTPGLDHPLKLKRQYFKNVGRQFKVHLTSKQVVQGKLEEASEERIVIEETAQGKHAESKKTEILYSEIERAFVMVSFKK